MGTPVIVEAVRTPIGKRGGWLAGLHAAELLGAAQRRLARPRRHRPRASSSRSSAAASPRPASSPTTSPAPPGWPPGCPSRPAPTTIDCQCGSAQQANHLIAGLIATGAIDVGIACGVEAMSRVPLGANVGTEAGPRRPDDLGHRPAQPVRGRRAHRQAPRHHPRRRRRARRPLAGARQAGLGRGPLRPRGAAGDRPRPRRGRQPDRRDQQVVTATRACATPRCEGARQAQAASSRAASTPRAPPRRSPTAPPPCC